jgi:hypothetical protein
MPDDLPRQRVGILFDAPHREGIEVIAMAEARCSGFHQGDEALGVGQHLHPCHMEMMATNSKR